MMRVVAMALVAVLALAAVGRAEPLDLKQVAADAKWVMHVDVDALRASAVVQKAYKKCLEMQKEAAQHMDKLPGMIGMDPRKDLHGITVYGKDLDKRKGVLIVHAGVNQQLLKEKAAKAPEHKMTKCGDYELHSWAMKGPHGAQTITGAFFKPNVMVFGGSQEAVSDALSVLAGKSAGITGADAPLAGRTLPGSVLVARAAAVDPNTRCPVLKQADSFRIALGENQGQSFYRARVNMKSTEAVDQVKTITAGFRAVVSLNKNMAPEVLKLIDGLKVAGEGKTLSITWNAKADDVWTAIEKAAKKMGEHKWQGGAKKGECPVHGDVHKGKPCPKGEKPKAHKPSAQRGEEF
jgi:hypothetical protein